MATVCVKVARTSSTLHSRRLQMSIQCASIFLQVVQAVLLIYHESVTTNAFRLLPQEREPSRAQQRVPRLFNEVY
jgi:hypothetical protein